MKVVDIEDAKKTTKWLKTLGVYYKSGAVEFYSTATYMPYGTFWFIYEKEMERSTYIASDEVAKIQFMNDFVELPA